ncbi:unnamed protein product, partial [Didymodactylos carnosus]
LDKISEDICRMEEGMEVAKGGLSDWDANDKVDKKRGMDRHVDEVINNTAHGQTSIRA